MANQTDAQPEISDEANRQKQSETIKPESAGSLESLIGTFDQHGREQRPLTSTPTVTDAPVIFPTVGYSILSFLMFINTRVFGFLTTDW